MSAELFNPAYGEENGQEVYSELIERTKQLFVEWFGHDPELHSSAEVCECKGESCTFLYVIEPDIQTIKDFIEKLNNISSMLVEEWPSKSIEYVVSYQI